MAPVSLFIFGKMQGDQAFFMVIGGDDSCPVKTGRAGLLDPSKYREMRERLIECAKAEKYETVQVVEDEALV